MAQVLNFDRERLRLCVKQLAGEREKQLRTLYPAASSGVIVPMSRMMAEDDLPEHGQGQF